MADKKFLGQDFDLGFTTNEEGLVFAWPLSRVDLQAKLRNGVSPRAYDIGVIEGKPNLVQSLILRLKTQRGELTKLGHPNYGSRHHRLIGEPNNENNKSLIKLYILECLKQEPRLEGILKVDVKPGKGLENRDKVHIEIDVKIKGDHDPLNLVIPFSFEGSVE